jgi:hypothetical protein
MWYRDPTARIWIPLRCILAVMERSERLSERGPPPRQATSAVTMLREMVLQQVTKHAGSAKRSASHTRQIELWVGLWVENDQPLDHRLGFVVCDMPESRPLDD